MPKTVIECFSRGAKSYNDTSFIHEKSMESLLYAINLLELKPCSILDAGCGTGLFLSKLQQNFQETTLFGCDISDQMVEIAKSQSLKALISKQDVLDFDQDVDLTVSHFSFQWMQPLERYLNHFLKHSKYVAIAVPLQSSFSTWKDLLKEAGKKESLFPLPRIEDFENFISRALHIEKKSYDMNFHKALDFAKYLKNLGADFSKNTSFQSFKRPCFFDQPFQTSYEVLEIILKGDL